MSLLYSVIARGDIILSEYSSPASSTSINYSSAAQSILSKIPPNDSKSTYAAQDILFHYIKANDLVVLVVGTEAAGRRIPFAFSTELISRFKLAFNQNEIDDAPAFGMASFELDIKKLMVHFAETAANDPIKVAQAELSNVKDVMISNIESVLSRGERIDLLVSKTDSMSTQARAFRKRSTALRREMWWRDKKVMLFGIGIGALFLYLLFANFCGLALNHCSA